MFSFRERVVTFIDDLVWFVGGATVTFYTQELKMGHTFKVESETTNIHAYVEFRTRVVYTVT